MSIIDLKEELTEIKKLLRYFRQVKTDRRLQFDQWDDHSDYISKRLEEQIAKMELKLAPEEIPCK